MPDPSSPAAIPAAGLDAARSRATPRRFGILLLAVICLAGCGGAGGKVDARPGPPPPTSGAVPSLVPKAEGPRTAPRWEEVARYAGSDETETAPFTIAAGAIQWRVRHRCDAGTLTIETMPPPAKAGSLAAGACPGEGEGFSIQTGELRLGVEASGPWEAVVEQQVDTPVDEAPLAGMSDGTVVAEGSFYEIDEEGKGAVALHQLPDGTRALRFEGFEVFNNTDIVVWLSEASRPTTSAEAFEAPYIEIAPLTSTIGNQNYVVPPEVPTERIASVVVWCPPIRSAYLGATLAPAP